MIIAAIEYVTAGGVCGIALVVCGWFIIHTRNHPNKADIDKNHDSLKDSVQFKDVCDERTQRIESAIANVDDKVTKGFKRIEEAITAE